MISRVYPLPILPISRAPESYRVQRIPSQWDLTRLHLLFSHHTLSHSHHTHPSLPMGPHFLLGTLLCLCQHHHLGQLECRTAFLRHNIPPSLALHLNYLYRHARLIL